MVGDINMKHVGKFMGDVEIIENCREMSWCWIDLAIYNVGETAPSLDKKRGKNPRPHLDYMK